MQNIVTKERTSVALQAESALWGSSALYEEQSDRLFQATVQEQRNLLCWIDEKFLIPVKALCVEMQHLNHSGLKSCWKGQRRYFTFTLLIHTQTDTHTQSTRHIRADISYKVNLRRIIVCFPSFPCQRIS